MPTSTASAPAQCDHAHGSALGRGCVYSSTRCTSRRRQSDPAKGLVVRDGGLAPQHTTEKEPRRRGMKPGLFKFESGFSSLSRLLGGG